MAARVGAAVICAVLWAVAGVLVAGFLVGWWS